MGDVSVRRAAIGDLDDLTRLFDGYRQFYEQTPDINAAREFLRLRFLNEDSVIFIAHARGEAVGFTQLYPSLSSVSMGRIFVLNDLFVAPEARKLGVGARLLEAAFQYARKTGAIRLTLSTARTNATAQALYEATGWTRDDKFLVYNLQFPRA